MAQRRQAKLLVATVAPEMERNLNIRDSESFWAEQLKKFVAAHPAEGVELETVVRKGGGSPSDRNTGRRTESRCDRHGVGQPKGSGLPSGNDG